MVHGRQLRLVLWWMDRCIVILKIFVVVQGDFAVFGDNHNTMVILAFCRIDYLDSLVLLDTKTELY